MLLVVQHRGLAGGAARNHPIHALLNVGLDEVFETLPVDRSVGEEGGDERGNHALQLQGGTDVAVGGAGDGHDCIRIRAVFVVERKF